ncbi:hypothetical protein AVEN_89755-1 [Araneus ventricosus]|uniref:Uncharacterized protein n=1 Tax=Araneus ventricosus TaxID=182803 RepID=A0A4Y2IT44_ARAVE|nr:hypothetical protein AVEN_89755-1 [Araneus ventricosus]
MTRTPPELAPPLQTSAPHQREDVSPPTYNLACNRPNVRRIFSGIGFGPGNPSSPRPTPYHQATDANAPESGFPCMKRLKTAVLSYTSLPKYLRKLQRIASHAHPCNSLLYRQLLLLISI